MSYLETKRNAIMNAIASGGITNYFEGLTWKSGYFGSTGAITSPDASNQKYEEEFLELDTTKTYLIVGLAQSTRPNVWWFGIPEYNNEETFVTRIVKQGNTNLGYILEYTPTNPKQRFCTKTWSDGVSIGLYEKDELMSALVQLGD